MTSIERTGEGFGGNALEAVTWPSTLLGIGGGPLAYDANHKVYVYIAIILESNILIT